MIIAKNTVVSFHYRLSNSEGKELENSHDGHPSLYLHGANNIIRGLETAMEGKTTGDVFSVSVDAIDAYGPRVDGKVQRVPAKYLKHEKKLKAGKVVRINTDNGVVNGTVVKVGKFSVDVDMNHPLAGQDLVFDIEVVELREASAEEISHGHAHGVGGHQH